MPCDKRSYTNIGEQLYTCQLPNGLHVCVLPRRDFRRSFAMFATNYGGADRRFTHAGRLHETPAGVAHFLEHKLFDMPDGSNALNVLAQNGAQPNAFTSEAMTAYHFESTSGFYENLESLLTFVSTPYFTPETVAKEQGIIGQEIRMTEDSPGFAVYVNLMRCLYSTGPLRDCVAGTIESIAEITADTLYACHAAFYCPSNMCLAVVGDVDPEAVVSLAERILPTEGQAAPAPDYGIIAGELPVQARVEKQMAVSAPQFLAGVRLPLPEFGPGRLRAQLTSELAMQYLMGSSSPLFSALYEEGLVRNDFDYEISTAAGERVLLLGGESRDPDAVLARVLEAAAGVSAGLDEARFERVRRALYGRYLRRLEDFDQTAVDLVDGIFGGWCPLEAFEVLGQITAADCMGLLAEALQGPRMALSIGTPMVDKTENATYNE